MATSASLHSAGLEKVEQRLSTHWTAENKSGLHRNIKINYLTHVKDGNFSPLSWPLATVLDVYPGTDKVVIVVKLQSQHGILTRPVLKTFPLPEPKD